MCFSAEASLITGALLLPAGAYCVAKAYRKNRAYLPLSATPLLFGLQQLCEAGVWHGINNDDAGLVHRAAVAFLFFGFALWPAWVPFGAAALEDRREKRWLFFLLGAIGVTVGVPAFIAAAGHYGVWWDVKVVYHSIRYDFARFPISNPVGAVWQGLYMAAVLVPLLTLRDRRLRVLGVSILVAAVVTHVMFRYAFISVWCFFAAVLSAHVCYVITQLPLPTKAVDTPPETR